MNTIPPWANVPFQLMVHAETPLLGGDEFDRRIALISFDNAIEAAITTYLTLQPIHRGGRTYSRDDVNKWTKNYHAKLDFFGSELQRRRLSWSVERSHIVWSHHHRNEQYHGGLKGTPEIDVLQIARDAAVWIISILFDISDTETILKKAILDKTPQAPSTRDKKLDAAIDGQLGIIDAGEHSYYASELLFAADYSAYRDLGGKLTDESTAISADKVE